MNSNVTALAANGDPAALIIPTGFAFVWDDNGSGSNIDVTIWRPVCPPGK